MVRLPTFAVSGLVLSALLSGCAVGPDFQPPDNPLPTATLAPRAESGLAADDLQPTKVPADWWTLFNDDLLTSLEARAAQANPDLQAAASRLEESRAQLGIADSALLPQMGVNAGYTRDGLSANGVYASLGASTRPYSYWQSAFDASWEIDLWGHARRQQEEAAASVDASRYDQEAARVSLAAEVARNYLLLRGLQTRLAIVRQNLEIAHDALRLAESRERNGVATRFDTATASAQLATTEALALEVAHQRDNAMNALALLLGEAPRVDGELVGAMPVPHMPGQIPVGLPSDLAHRRPDILRAEARLHAATAAIGTAEADFYPRISLTGSLGTEAFQFADVGDWASRQFVVGPSIHLPIFEGGRLKSTLALTEARQKTAAIAYRQTVLVAWHEVANAIDAYTTELQRHSELDKAFEQNRSAFDVAQRSYQEGSADYLTVLVAQRNLLASQSALADDATAAGLSLVALYKSLAGGWDPAALSSPAGGGNS